MAIVMFSFLLIVGLTAAVPAKSLYDDASANDVGINSVHGSETSTTKAVVDVPVSTVQFDVKLNEGPTIPPRGNSGFSRIIDDIFNIPITVLQSVAKLLTNPFKQQAKLPSTY